MESHLRTSARQGGGCDGSRQSGDRDELQNQDKKVLPEGHIGFVSLVPFEVKVKFGSNEASIPAGGRVSVSSGLADKEAAMVGLQMAAPVDGEWRLIESKQIAFDPSSRSLLLLSPGEGKPLRLTFIDAAPADPVDPDAAALQAAQATSTRKELSSE